MICVALCMTMSNFIITISKHHQSALAVVFSRSRVEEREDDQA